MVKKAKKWRNIEILTKRKEKKKKKKVTFRVLRSQAKKIFCDFDITLAS